ncbi:acetoacetate--CoA ligase [Mycobacterium sp. 21AC1]|uniref:acetoacetate--CoA ligase n=1 Tax=[Mycobacterium] appelbergii TaxID=2939269 RepID=UPI002938EBE6|nr:acetoacetate--CoA ligase [Mycobacterium sp. 21AC1]MDV3128443.1 acetoacetate--CoA ligase [Mycobacterium sp. 21AC1]
MDRAHQLHAPELPIWVPGPAQLNESAIARFSEFVARRYGVDTGTYLELYEWSTTDLDGFWSTVADYFEVTMGPAEGCAIADERMPGGSWFPGRRLNYAEHALRPGPDRRDDSIAVTEIREDGAVDQLTWAELRHRVAALAGWLRAKGVVPGDRVVGYLPNAAAAVVAFLATASVGAVWAACAQDYSPAGAAARLGQLEPVVLFIADGYTWNGNLIDRRRESAELRALLPTVRFTVEVPYLGPTTAADDRRPGIASWDDTQRHATQPPDASPRYESMDFDAPLWVLFSSGTTGVPKGLVHSHGGVVLEHLKFIGLHLGADPARPLFWYTTTNWMMWNVVVSGLLLGAPIVVYDGSPTYPGPQRLWEIAAQHGVSVLGVSPGYLATCEKSGLIPRYSHDLSALDVLGVTGAPLPARSYHWVHSAVGPEVQLASSSGGTDVATAFAASAPNTEVWPGELSAPCLGVALQAWDSQGCSIIGDVGELVITKPMPSMPVRMWNDDDGSRYRDSYFQTYPGVWRHGDWVEITDRHSVVITGRSDATLNRSGVRLGSAEVYRVLDPMPELADALIIGAELGNGGYWMVLFVVLAADYTLDERLIAQINDAVRSGASPRHVPDDIIAVPGLPHTRTGKKLEVPVKRLIQGHALADVASRDSVDDYDALAQFTAYARAESPRAPRSVMGA